MEKQRTWLTLDQGNTCLDAVLFGDDCQVLESWQDTQVAQLDADLGADRRPSGVSFCSVRGADGAKALELLLQASFGLGGVPDCGLIVEVDEPQQVGRDRLFAGRGAYARFGAAAAIVVDVGTAMTVDLICEGRFLGGAIAPGPKLLAKALGDGAAQLFEVEAHSDVRALGRNTREALEAGVVIGLRGAAQALVDGLDRPGAVIALTGGARHLLLGAPGLWPGRQVVEAPLLVHEGLLAASKGIRE